MFETAARNYRNLADSSPVSQVASVAQTRMRLPLPRAMTNSMEGEVETEEIVCYSAVAACMPSKPNSEDVKVVGTLVQSLVVLLSLARMEVEYQKVLGI